MCLCDRRRVERRRVQIIAQERNARKAKLKDPPPSSSSPPGELTLTEPVMLLFVKFVSGSIDANTAVYDLLPAVTPVTPTLNVEVDWLVKLFDWQSICCAVTVHVPMDQLALLACSPLLSDMLNVNPLHSGLLWA